jgi:hypothetical protein
MALSDKITQAMATFEGSVAANELIRADKRTTPTQARKSSTLRSSARAALIEAIEHEVRGGEAFQALAALVGFADPDSTLDQATDPELVREAGEALNRAREIVGRS